MRSTLLLMYLGTCATLLLLTNCNVGKQEKEQAVEITTNTVVEDKPSISTTAIEMGNGSTNNPQSPPPPPNKNVILQNYYYDIVNQDEALVSTEESEYNVKENALGEKSITGGAYVWTGSPATTKSINLVGKKELYDQQYFIDGSKMKKDEYMDEHDQVDNRSDYTQLIENKFINPRNNPFSTFSIDVDNASYSNVRQMIAFQQMPPKEAVRIEEMINYFKYDYPNPIGEDPFSINTEMAPCPWNAAHQLLLVGIQGKKLNYTEINPSNLVFLVDVSGSMAGPGRLPLVKESMKLMVDNLGANDKIAIVVYAGNAGLVLPSTSAADKATIKRAIDNLEAGGSTAGGAGIQLAYKIAEQNFMKGGNNRIVLATDGDFNVGVNSDRDLKSLIETEREKKIFLTVAGYGMGNYKDTKMETLADNGNGNYFYIDNIKEAQKVFQTDMRATLFTIAKDVKLQLEFNANKIAAYRLVGYENRMLAKEDFNNDKKDAGELGPGHCVTALYEIIPVGSTVAENDIDDNNFKRTNLTISTLKNDELLVLNLRYKQPDGDVSKLISHSLKVNELKTMVTSANFRFASSVALFGMLLKDSKYSNHKGYSDVIRIAEASTGVDAEGYRKEFIKMVKDASLLANR